jgi:hypothetical protein
MTLARPLPVVCIRGVSLLSILNAFPVRQADVDYTTPLLTDFVSHNLFNAVSGVTTIGGS